MRISLFCGIVNVAGIIAAAALIWSPVIGTYWVWSPTLSEPTIERAITEPEDEILAEISRQRLGLSVIAKSNLEREKAETLLAAEQLLLGKVQFPKQPSMHLRMPFHASNLDVGPPTHQLYIAGLGTVALLLRAYRISANDRFLSAVREEVAAFAEIDRWALMPRGFIWNDHALANRISILAELWQIIRARDDLDHSLARQVLALAARTAERLAKPELFTYRSNHGVMQNIALLQFVTAFPSIESTARLRELACARQKDQMEYYISPKGTVLEHSAGYHEFGRYLLETSIRLFVLNNCKVPIEWYSKLKLARRFSTLLRRPDGSLPPLGNTDYSKSAERYGDWVAGPPVRPFALYPVSGFAVWWHDLSLWPRTDRLSQTLVTWSSFPSRAHKRADDMSVLVWAGGHSWLGNSGYWPYGAPGFDAAQGWRGSNAPHFVGEVGAGTRPSRLRGVVNAGRVRALELERRVVRPGGVLQRQIIDIDGSTWLIADSFDSHTLQQVERVWTMLPETRVTALAEKAFLLSVPDMKKAARLSLVGDLTEVPGHFRGQLDPFGGWIVRNGEPTAAPAISVLQSTPKAPVITILELGSESELGTTTLPVLESGSSADRWQVSLTTVHGFTEIFWNSGSLTVRFADGSELNTRLSAPPDPGYSRDEIVAAYSRVAESYPRFRDLTYYRYRVTYLGIGLLVLQEVVVLGVRRWLIWAVPTMRFLAAACWLAFGLLAALWYLR